MACSAMAYPRSMCCRDPMRGEESRTIFMTLEVLNARNAQRRNAAALTVAQDLNIRLEVAKSTNNLDLSDCGLQEIPEEIFSMVDLVDLSLAGNKITFIPEDIKNLTKLRRLGLAGNLLTSLPESIGGLVNLEGLWLHGNILLFLPPQIGELHQLRTLALAGNVLRSLPCSLEKLVNLRVLSVAGNRLEELPSGIGLLSSLQILALYGNQLRQLPESISRICCLQELLLQGNFLETIPNDISGLVSLRHMSLADNQLVSLPESIWQLQSLETLSLYGNKLKEIPAITGEVAKLRNIWLEGNPLEAEPLQSFIMSLRSLSVVGISSDVFADDSRNMPHVVTSKVAGTGKARDRGGYFKLDCSKELNGSNVVVVAFGSAPGVPNWGGLLRKVKQRMREEGLIPAFDILYVVDSRRSWYMEDKFPGLFESNIGQEPCGRGRAIGSYYKEELEAALKCYKHIIMIGDSMGASAALWFSPLATSVIAFCPQVDLTTSSIRPGKEKTVLDTFQASLLKAVTSTSASIVVHTGNWAHDIAQAKLLPEKVTVQIHNFNDHRLAKHMDANGSLLPLIWNQIIKDLTSKDII